MTHKQLVNIAIETKTKEEADKVFSQLDITANEAVELFYRQVALYKTLPFSLKNPNQKTINAIQELELKENLPVYKTFAQLRQDLGV